MDEIEQGKIALKMVKHGLRKRIIMFLCDTAHEFREIEGTADLSRDKMEQLVMFLVREIVNEHLSRE